MQFSFFVKNGSDLSAVVFGSLLSSDTTTMVRVDTLLRIHSILRVHRPLASPLW